MRGSNCRVVLTGRGENAANLPVYVALLFGEEKLERAAAPHEKENVVMLELAQAVNLGSIYNSFY